MQAFPRILYQVCRFGKAGEVRRQALLAELDRQKAGFTLPHGYYEQSNPGCSWQSVLVKALHEASICSTSTGFYRSKSHPRAKVC